MPAIAMDGWTQSLVAAIATTIRTMAPTRSDHGARLNNSHQRTTASPPTTPPRTASRPIGSEATSASGAILGTPNASSHCRTTMTTPGHSRSGLRDVGPLWVMVIGTPRVVTALDGLRRQARPTW